MRGERTGVDFLVVVNDSAPDMVGTRASNHAAGGFLCRKVLDVWFRLRAIRA